MESSTLTTYTPPATLTKTTTTTTTKLPPLSFSPRTLSVPSPTDYHNSFPQTTSTTNTVFRRSPARVKRQDLVGDNDTDSLQDNLFESSAWKKKRGSAGGSGGSSGKKSRATGSEKGNDGKRKSGSDASLDGTKRWALVQLVEQQAKKVKGHARQWWREVCEGCEGFQVWWHQGSAHSFSKKESKEQADPKRRQSGTPLSASPGTGGGGRPLNGLAVPTAVRDSNTPLATEILKGETKGELTVEAVAQETQLLIGNYIYHRLNSKALMSKRVPAAAPLHSQSAHDLCTAGQELERLYPRVYTDVSRRISMTMTSAQIVRRALMAVLEEIFKTGITWARVVAMVAISAAFAEECVVQGHPNFVEDVVVCGGHFVTLKLGDWLIRQGGWASFPTPRSPVTQREDSFNEGSGGYMPMVAGLALIAALFTTLLFLVSILLRSIT